MNTDIKIDFNLDNGNIRALHGVNNGPVCLGSLLDVTEYYKDVEIPYVRMHDTNWPNPREVDIYTIFPDFSLDEMNPDNYDFSRTDEYIKSILNTGAKIIYRLGVSIEHTKEKYHTDPPDDFKKWANICIGIIMHYNHGWAKGFFYNIRYWEIWNEPDNPDGNCMWSGTPDQYYELYKTAATTIKKFDPTLKVGGFGATMVNIPFVKGFLEYCKNNTLSLDFFSWHTYTSNPEMILKNAKIVADLLKMHGFGSSESHFNEWNYACNDPEIKAIFRAGNEYDTQEFFERSKGVEGASFDAAVLIALQDCPVDVANFYDAAPSSYWSLFNLYGIPQKNYYAFKAFRMLLSNPQRVKTTISSGINGLYCCSGINKEKNEMTVLISNFNSEEREYKIEICNLPNINKYIYQTYLVDQSHNLEMVGNKEKHGKKINDTIHIARNSILLLRIKGA